MTPKRQLVAGIVFIGLGLVAALFHVAGNGNVNYFLVLILGAAGGQMLGQVYRRGKRQKE